MTRVRGRKRRHYHIRKKIVGTKEKPRLSLYRGINNITAQLIDDLDGRTLMSLSSASKGLKGKVKSWGNVEGAVKFGEIFAEEAIKKGFSAIVFDRGGYQYHGRVKALADACRKKGLQF